MSFYAVMNLFSYKKNFLIVFSIFLLVSLFSQDLSSVVEQKKSASDVPETSLLSALDGKDEEGLSEYKEEKDIINRLRTGQLRKFIHEKESLSIYDKDRNENLVLTSSSTDLLVRRTYTKDYTILKKEVFNNPATFNGLKKKSLTEYFYSGNEVLKTSKTEFFDENRYEETQFLPSGKIASIEKYHYEEDKDKKKYLQKDSELTFSYDNQGRLSVKKIIQNFQDLNKAGKKIITKRTRTYEYKYGAYSNPNVFFYENGVLREKLIYTTQTDFTQTLYFDEEFSVVSEFKDGIKVEEIVFLNGNEVRRQIFEND